MKLVIAAEIFPPDIGGPATYSKQLAEILAGENYHWKVKLICYSTKIENDGYPFPVIRILRGQGTLNRYGQYLWNLLKIAKKADVIYAQGPVSSGLPTIIAGFLLSKKVVVKITGDYAWEQARNSGQTEIGIDEFQTQQLTGKIGWLKKIEKWICRKADRIIVPSQYLKRLVVGWGIKKDKIEVIYNAYEPASALFIKQINQNILVSIGRLVSWKGFDILIDSVAELINDNYDFSLVIYGKGPERDKLEEKIAQLKLGHRILIHALPHHLLMDKLNKEGGIFILNSGYEGLPHTVLEVMAIGLPVITTKVSGNPEVIQDGYNGLLVEYNNKEQLKAAILKLYNNPEWREKFVQNSKETLKKFTFENMINKTINTLKNL